MHLVVKMRLVQFCSIKRSSVCGLKFGGGVVFSQICSVASGAFKEQYKLLVSLNSSVSERKLSIPSDGFLPILKPKCLPISTICVIASLQTHPCNENRVVFPTEKNLFSSPVNPVMKTGFSLCGNTTQGKPCSGPVLAL